MQLARQISEMREFVRLSRPKQRRIGCVPTMGALHAGHLSLVAECRKHVDDVVVTIFVNPTQFGPSEDLSRYPRPLEADLRACREAGVDCVFLPEITNMYEPGHETWVDVDGMSAILEGAIRPGHFRGVATIVAKLFNIVQPDVACFGAKDYQQQAILRRMVQQLDFPIEMVICPTQREPDGLALSSRNAYLSEEERRSAIALNQALEIAEKLVTDGERNIAILENAMLQHLSSVPLVEPQYAVLRDPDTLETLSTVPQRMIGLIAAKVGQTRLIDNRMILQPTSGKAG